MERHAVPTSWFTHLECSVPCGAPALDPRGRHNLCRCGAPLLARYDLQAARSWDRASLVGREASMWRYRELMPLLAGESPEQVHAFVATLRAALDEA